MDQILYMNKRKDLLFYEVNASAKQQLYFNIYKFFRTWA